MNSSVSNLEDQEKSPDRYNQSNATSDRDPMIDSLANKRKRIIQQKLNQAKKQLL